MTFVAVNNTLQHKVEFWTWEENLYLQSVILLGNFTKPLINVVMNGSPVNFTKYPMVSFLSV